MSSSLKIHIKINILGKEITELFHGKCARPIFIHRLSSISDDVYQHWILVEYERNPHHSSEFTSTMNGRFLTNQIASVSRLFYEEKHISASKAVYLQEANALVKISWSSYWSISPSWIVNGKHKWLVIKIWYNILKNKWEETLKAFARLYTVQSNFLILILALPIVNRIRKMIFIAS